MEYILLLRGISVGEKNKISMKDLKEALEKNDFKDVITYINSGNIIFNSELNIDTLEKRVHKILEESFNLNIPILIIEVSDVIKAVEKAPKWWGEEKDSKHNTIFVVRSSSVDQIIKEVGTFKEEYEKVASSGRIIFWSAPIKTFSKTKWSKIDGNKVYDKITIRNYNTVKKLVELGRERNNYE